jgi:hypothetical protein
VRLRAAAAARRVWKRMRMAGAAARRVPEIAFVL